MRVEDKISIARDFPGSSVVKTPCFHGQGCGFNPWSGNWDPPSHVSQEKERKKETRRCQVSLQGLRFPMVAWQNARGGWGQYRVGGVAAGPNIDWTPLLPSCVATGKLLASLFLFHLL